MKEVKSEKKIKIRDPRESLEKILSVEIEIANQLSDTREKAEKRIIKAQSNLNSLKAKMIEDARREREQLIQKGVEKAHKDAEKKISAAQAEADQFLKTGNKHLNDARDHVLLLLLGNIKGSL